MGQNQGFDGRFTLEITSKVKRMDRRTKYDIYADLLKTVMKKGSCGVTRASYGANLPIDRAKKFLKFLASRRFVREVMDVHVCMLNYQRASILGRFMSIVWTEQTW